MSIDYGAVRREAERAESRFAELTRMVNQRLLSGVALDNPELVRLQMELIWERQYAIQARDVLG